MKEITNISQKSPLCIPAFLNTGLFALLIAFLAPFANCKSDNKKDAPAGPRDPLINTSLQTKCEMDSGGSKEHNYLFKTANSGDRETSTYSSTDCTGVSTTETKSFQYDRAPGVSITVDVDSIEALKITITIDGVAEPVEIYYVSDADSDTNTDQVYVSDGPDDTVFTAEDALDLVSTLSTLLPVDSNWIGECKWDPFADPNDDGRTTECAVDTDCAGSLICASDPDDSSAPMICSKYRRTVHIIGSDTLQELDLFYTDSTCETFEACLGPGVPRSYTRGPTVSRQYHDGSTVLAQEVTFERRDMPGYFYLDGNDLRLNFFDDDDGTWKWNLFGSRYSDPLPSVCR